MAKRGPKKKAPMGITPEFVDSLASASAADKKSMIVRMQKDLEDSLTFLKTNDKIVTMKEQLKEIEGPTRDTVKALRNRSKYVIEELKSVGEI